MEKNKAVYFRLSEEELKLIDAKAKAARMSRSKYLIQAAQSQRLEIFGGDELREFNKLLRELSSDLRRIGVNVNQIAVLTNMGKVNCVHLEDTSNNIAGIWGELEKIRNQIKKIKNGGKHDEENLIHADGSSDVI